MMNEKRKSDLKVKRKTSKTNRSSECFPISEDSEIVRDPESAELKNEGLEGRVRLDVEGRVRHRISRTCHVVEEGSIVEARDVVVLVVQGVVVKEGRDVGLGAIVHQLDGRVRAEKLK